jgi:uncharacterized YccA/Bax inhibitor family protein
MTLNIGLAAGCMVIGLLMLFIGGWFSFTGLRDRDWSTFFFSLMILGVAAFAFYSAYSLIAW